MSPISKTDNVLFVGIDLGTSRSVIAASNGQRHWVESYVGWPKDFVAKKMLKRPVLFGAEALEHRLALNVHRPLEHGVLKEGTAKDAAAVEALIGHLIALVQAEPGDSICAAVGVPAEALKINKIAIRTAIKDHAAAMMVVSEPFAVAYGVGALDNAMVIDIGAGTVDFCIMHGTVPSDEDQRSLVTAGDYVDEQLLKMLSEKYPKADFTLNMVRKFKEEHGFVGEPASKVEVKVPVEGRFITHDITQELRKACEGIVPSIVETAMELIAGFDPEYQEKVRNNIILAGGGSLIKGIDRYLAEAIRKFEPCNVSCVEDPLHAGANGALELAKDMPEEYLEQL